MFVLISVRKLIRVNTSPYCCIFHFSSRL